MRIVGIGTNLIKDSIWWDNVNGTSGRDMIEITWGNDTVNAGGGNDVIWDIDGNYQNGSFGNPGDHIWASSDDVINGGDGDDLIFAGLGADRMDGGTGWDTVDYRYSRAAVYVDLSSGRGSGASNSGSAGDILTGIEEVRGSYLGDTLKGGAGLSNLFGDGGNDFLHGGTGATRMFGGEGQDTFVFTSLSNTADGGEGVDSASFYKLGSGVRIFSGNTSLEAIGTGAQVHYGLNNIENVTGTRFADFIGESSADNVFQTYDGNDVVYAGLGRDVVMGGTGHDRVHGGFGNDILQGESGIDQLFGDANDDQLFGGADDDRLNGGSGIDTMTGGSGMDVFAFDGYSMNSGVDVITDFVQGSDKIDLSQLDAVSSIFGNQAFILRVGGGTGTVSTHFSNGQTIVEAHTNDDGRPEVVFALNGLFKLGTTDFIL